MVSRTGPVKIGRFIRDLDQALGIVCDASMDLALVLALFLTHTNTLGTCFLYAEHIRSICRLLKLWPAQI